MLVVMKMDADPDEIRGVVREIEQKGLKASPIAGAQRTAIGITGNIVTLRSCFRLVPGANRIAGGSGQGGLNGMPVAEPEVAGPQVGERAEGARE